MHRTSGITQLKLDQIAKLKARAAGLNRSFKSVCQAAEADYSLFNRWENQLMCPTDRVFGIQAEKVAGALQIMEREMFLKLAPLFLPEQDVSDLTALIEQAAANGVAVQAGAPA